MTGRVNQSTFDRFSRVAASRSVEFLRNFGTGGVLGNEWRSLDGFALFTAEPPEFLLDSGLTPESQR